jgi:hypothetical protein
MSTRAAGRMPVLPGTGPLRRVVLAYGLFTLVEYSVWLVVILYAFQVSGPGLAAVVGRAEWFTHLRGTIAGDALLHDLEPRWTEAVDRRWVVWSLRGAAIAAANWTSLGAVVAFAVLALRLRARPTDATSPARPVGVIAGVALLVFCGLTFLRPTVPVTPAGSRRVENLEERRRIARIDGVVAELKTRNTPIDAETVRTSIDQALRRWAPDFRPIRELDAPGHHAIEVGTNRIDVLVYDKRGGFKRFTVPRRP